MYLFMNSLLCIFIFALHFFIVFNVEHIPITDATIGAASDVDKRRLLKFKLLHHGVEILIRRANDFDDRGFDLDTLSSLL